MRLITVLMLLLALTAALIAQDVDALNATAEDLGEAGEWEDLFNGEDLTGWVKVKGHTKDSWSVEDGILTNVCTHDDRGSDLGTERLFTDHQIHVEFRVPEAGNSGVYVQGRYEAQIADTAAIEEPTMGHCGGIWAVSDPLVQAAKPVGEWQSYDILFLAPKVDDAGNVTAAARMTVYLNGVLVQDDVALEWAKPGEPVKPQPTGGQIDDNITEPGCLMLQGDHSSMEYKNIKVREITLN